jgi:hypothetical protein
MTDNKVKSNRQFAASLARKYFGGQISKPELLDNFPDHTQDVKLFRLHDAIVNEPKIGWLLGVTKEEHSDYVIATYKLIDALEIEGFQIEVMQRLFKELWFASDNCKSPIKHIGIHLAEVGKSTNNTRDEVREYVNLLIQQNYFELVSKEPLLFQFTEKGKTIKTQDDIKQILNNVA